MGVGDDVIYAQALPTVGHSLLQPVIKMKNSQLLQHCACLDAAMLPAMMIMD